MPGGLLAQTGDGGGGEPQQGVPLFILLAPRMLLQQFSGFPQRIMCDPSLQAVQLPLSVRRNQQEFE